MGNPRWICVAVPLLVWMSTVEAHAQSRKPEAEALFNEGKALMAKGEFAAACEKFEASKAYDPRATTLMNLGACREREKKLTSAWYAFLEASKLAAQSSDETGLAAPAKKQADALEPRLSTLTIVVAPSARVPGLTITRDGEPILAGQWNSAAPIDGGEYTIVARATGTDAWTSTIAIASERDKKSVEIPVLKPAPEGPRPEPQPQPQPPPQPQPSPQPQPPAEDLAPDRDGSPGTFTGMRKASLGVAVVGAAALAGGAVFGMKAKSKQADADDICPDRICNDADGLRLNDEAQDAAGTANLMFIGGGVAVAGAVALWFLGAPSSVAPEASDEMVGLTFRGEF